MPTQAVTSRHQAETGSSHSGAVIPISASKPRLSAKSTAYAIETLRARLGTKLIDDAFIRSVAEQARVLTGAIGVVIALRQEGPVVCVASSGAAAPAPGTPIDTRGGISGECLRSGKSLCCNDSENDPRVDVLLCRNLGLRSIAAVPILEYSKIAGLIEVFAEVPNAFDDQSMEVLRSLATLLGKSATSPTVNETQSTTKVPGDDRKEDRVEARWWLIWPALHPYQAAVGGFLLLDILAAYLCFHH
jgi:hypothetical protein